MNIPPPILENFCNQGGDDDGDGHEHEDEHDFHTQWRLSTNFDGSPLLVCIQCTEMLLLRDHVLSPMVTLFGPIPTPVAMYSRWILVC